MEMHLFARVRDSFVAAEFKGTTDEHRWTLIKAVMKASEEKGGNI